MGVPSIRHVEGRGARRRPFWRWPGSIGHVEVHVEATSAAAGAGPTMAPTSSATLSQTIELRPNRRCISVTRG